MFGILLIFIFNSVLKFFVLRYSWSCFELKIGGYTLIPFLRICKKYKEMVVR